MISDVPAHASMNEFLGHSGIVVNRKKGGVSIMAPTDQLTILGSYYFHLKGNRNNYQINVFCDSICFLYCVCMHLKEVGEKEQ